MDVFLTGVLLALAFLAGVFLLATRLAVAAAAWCGEPLPYWPTVLVFLAVGVVCSLVYAAVDRLIDDFDD